MYWRLLIRVIHYVTKCKTPVLSAQHAWYVLRFKEILSFIHCNNVLGCWQYTCWYASEPINVVMLKSAQAILICNSCPRFSKLLTPSTWSRQHPVCLVNGIKASTTHNWYHTLYALHKLCGFPWLLYIAYDFNHPAFTLYLTRYGTRQSCIAVNDLACQHYG